MSYVISGLDELLRDLDAVPDKGREKWPKVLSRGGVQIKLAWRRRWSSPEIGNPPQHLPHVVRGIGYDTDKNEAGTKFSVEVGVSKRNPQASLAHFAEFGTPFPPTPPHPGGQPSLDEEEPGFVAAVGDVAVEILEGR